MDERILLAILPSIEFGGCERYFLAVCRAAASRGWKVHAVISDTPSLVLFREELRKHVVRIGDWRPAQQTSNLLNVGAQRAAMVEQLEETKPACVFYGVPWMPTVIGAMRAVCALNFPFVACFQLVDETINLGRSATREFQEAIATGLGIVVAVSQPNQARLAASLGVDAQAIRLVPNGVDARRHQNRGIHRLGQAPRVMSVGRLVPEKGYPAFISACRMVSSQSGSAFEAIWVGDGPDRERVGELNSAAGHPVNLIGQSNEVPQLLANCDLYVHASMMEGLSFALLEAMEAGVGIIASGIAENQELIRPGDTGLLFDSGDTKQLASQLRWALHNRAAMRTLGRNAQRLVHKNYTRPRMLDSTIHLFEEVVRR